MDDFGPSPSERREPASSRRYQRSRGPGVLIVVVAALATLSLWLPLASVSFIVAAAHMYGIEFPEGKILLVALIVTALAGVGAIGVNSRVMITISGVLALITAMGGVVIAVRATTQTGNETGLVIGVGALILLVSSVALAAAGVLALISVRTTRKTGLG